MGFDDIFGRYGYGGGASGGTGSGFGAIFSRYGYGTGFADEEEQRRRKLAELEAARTGGERQFREIEKGLDGGWLGSVMSAGPGMKQALTGLAMQEVERGPWAPYVGRLDLTKLLPDEMAAEAKGSALASLRESAKDQRRDIEALMPADPNIAQQALASLPQTAAVLGATAIGGPVAGASLGFGLARGPSYLEARERGVSPEMAGLKSGLEASAIGALESVGAGGMLGAAWKAGPKAVGQFLTRMARGVTGEIGTEGTQEMASIAAEAATGKYSNLDELVSDIRERVPNAMAVGGLVAGPLTGTATTASYLGRERTAPVAEQPRPPRLEDMSREELLRLATTSPQTELPNRRVFFDAIEQKEAERPFTVSADLDGLKLVNDQFGHDAGDMLLRKKADVARELGIDLHHLSGDEFGARFRSADEADRLMTELRRRLESDPLVFETQDGQRVEVPVRFSYAVGPTWKDADPLLKRAKDERAAAGLRTPRSQPTAPDGGSAALSAAGEQAPGLQERPRQAEVAAAPLSKRLREAAKIPSDLTQAEIAYLDFLVEREDVESNVHPMSGAAPRARLRDLPQRVRDVAEFRLTKRGLIDDATGQLSDLGRELAGEVHRGEKAWRDGQPYELRSTRTEWDGTKRGQEPIEYNFGEGHMAVAFHDGSSFWSIGKPKAATRSLGRVPIPWQQEQFGQDVTQQGIEARTAPAVKPATVYRQPDSTSRKRATWLDEIGFSDGTRVQAEAFDYLERLHGSPDRIADLEWRPVGEGGARYVVLFSKSKNYPLGGLRATSTEAVATEPGGDRVEARFDEPVPDEALRFVPPGIETLSGAGRLREILRKWGTSKGVLSTEARDIRERREGTMAATEFRDRDLSDALRRATRSYLRQHQNVDPARFTESVRDVLHGTVKPGAAPLPKVIQDLAAKMRTNIDALSRTNAAQLRSSRPELADVIEGNLGKYVFRGYAAFDDPKHLQKMQRSGRWQAWRDELAQMPEFAGKSEAEIEGFMEHLAARKDDFFSTTGSGFGTLELGIYRHRKEIPKVMREIMGEHSDPAIEYLKTTQRLQRNVSTFDMFSALRALGRKEGWLSDVPVRGLSTEIGGVAARSPIGGMFTSKDIAQEIAGSNDRAQRTILGVITGIIKVNKTVGSAQGQMRNVESNILLLAGAGNLGTKFLPWGWRTKAQVGTGAALKAVQVRSGNRALSLAEQGRLAEASDADVRGVWGRFVELVGGNSTVELADLRRFFGESNKLASDSDPARAIWGALKKSYRLGDEIPKFMHWQSEIAKILWYDPKASYADAERRAATIVRDITPTDGRQIKAIRHLRETPLVGGFISFVSEIPRNAKNIAKLGLTEIREGSKSGNKRQVVVGVHRLGSLTAALAAPAIAQQVVAAIRESYGDEPDEREQESVRVFLPPWMQASEVNILRMEKGRALVLDASFMDPWATIKKPLLAAIREGPSAAFWQAIEPYAQEGLGLKTLVDLNRNENGYTGREIVDPDAPLDIKAKAYGEYAWTAAQPGIVTSATRIGKGASGYVEPNGRTYSLRMELAALFGPRFMWIDAKQGLRAAARDYLDGQRRASGALNAVERREGGAPAGEVDDARRTAEAAWTAGARRLAEAVEGARGMGLSKVDIIKALREAKVSGEDVGAALKGIDALDKRRREKDKERAERRKKESRPW